MKTPLWHGKKKFLIISSNFLGQWFSASFEEEITEVTGYRGRLNGTTGLSSAPGPSSSTVGVSRLLGMETQPDSSTEHQQQRGLGRGDVTASVEVTVLLFFSGMKERRQVKPRQREDSHHTALGQMPSSPTESPGGVASYP